MKSPNKLSKEQADMLIAKSIEKCLLTGNRLGSTIWSELTLKQLSNIVHPDKDIFYIKDDELAKEMFIKFCVEESSDEEVNTTRS